VTIVAQSFGGNIALRYAGVFPENVRKLVAIEGMGPSPKMMAERFNQPVDKRIRQWIDNRRAIAGRTQRRYATLEDAYKRMREENHHLSDEQAHHLTIHGVSQNEDGTYSWKFDNYMRVFPPYDIAQSEVEAIWSKITCPTLLMYGEDSWASNPEADGRARHIKTARVVSFANAGHWLHHDQFDRFIAELRAFL
jgi:pimeloyl-ACP methyl ester carboxylesterase